MPEFGCLAGDVELVRPTAGLNVGRRPRDGELALRHQPSPFAALGAPDSPGVLVQLLRDVFESCRGPFPPKFAPGR